MNKIKAAAKIVSCVMTGFLFTGVFSIEVDAGECDQLVAELSQIKGLIKRKSFLDEAVKDCADDYLVTYYYAYNFERRRKYDRALYYYKSAITLNPDYARSYFGLGDTYLALQKNKEAVAALEKGLYLDPGNTWAEKSLKKAKQELPMQALQKSADVNLTHEEAAEEVVDVSPLFSAIPDKGTFLKPVGNELEEVKDITVQDFIDRMRVDSGTALDAQNLNDVVA